MTLPGGMEGLSFLFNPRFEDLTASAIVLALGHSFFTVSLGMGTMITYGSYLDKKQNLMTSALWVIFLDTAIAMLAGIAIFTTVFALGANPAEGPGLIFVVLPTVFAQMAGGAIWSTMFFILLFMAALTSAISILEVVTAYFIDQKGWSRKKATIQFGAVITDCGCILFILFRWWHQYYRISGNAIYGFHGLSILEIYAAYWWDAYGHICPEKMGHL